MIPSEALGLLKSQLQNGLGEKFTLYMKTLKEWFNGEITKDMYDYQMSQYLDFITTQSHNKFMKAILFACYSGEAALVNSLEGEESKTSDQVAAEETLYIAPPEPEASEWLTKVQIQQVNIEDDQGPTDLKNQFPIDYVFHEMRGITDAEYYDVPNVTYSVDISERLEKNPKFKPHFKPANGNSDSLSFNSRISVYGKFLLKAWEYNLEGVELQAGVLAFRACMEHMKAIIRAAVKERKPFRVREDGTCHSIGAPYPNPYLLQGHHIYDEPCGSDSMRMADIMQIPPLLALKQEKERLAVLQASASLPPKYNKYLDNKVTVADVYDALQNNPGLIPKNTLRQKVLEKLLARYSGYHGPATSYDECEDSEDDSETCVDFHRSYTVKA